MLHSLMSPLCAFPDCAPHRLCAPHCLCALHALPPGPLLKSLSAGGQVLEGPELGSWCLPGSSLASVQWPQTAGPAGPARKTEQCQGAVCLQGALILQGAPWAPSLTFMG